MKRVLLTGGTGFIGINILPIISEVAEVFAPRRAELDLKSETAVRNYLIENKIDYVLHCANPNPVKNSLDSQDMMFEDSLRIFMNLYAARDIYEKMFFLGSGAEYNKDIEMHLIEEIECFRKIPDNSYASYGLAKYIENALASKSDNIYNLRVFACYGPHDHSTKFISHCINCCLRGKDITINQDCYFDFLHVEDLGKMLAWHLTHDQKYHDYNMTYGNPILLSDIAKEVRRQMNSDAEIIVKNPGLNMEYTGSNKRFVEESGFSPTISIEEGISKQIEWEKAVQ